MGNKDYLKLGSWNVICDRCGFKAKGEDLIEEWNGLKVHPHCHEPRNAQDFLTGVPDGKPKGYYRPVAEEKFVDAIVTTDPYTLVP